MKVGIFYADVPLPNGRHNLSHS